jgi:hypothetical protein
VKRQDHRLVHLAWLALLSLLLTVTFLLVDVVPAEAATITVTGTGNTLANDGACTLPEALFNANFNSQSYPDCAGGGGEANDHDTIRFQIPTFQDAGCNFTSRVCTILPTAALQILQSVTIDGYTQTNTSPNTLAIGNDAVIRIRLLPGGVNAFTSFDVQANDVTIRGLAIGGYGTGLVIGQYARARIVGCYFGLDPDGTTARPNGAVGISVAGQSAVIGGTAPADRNVISSSNGTTTSAGISLSSLAQSATIQGNYIGTDRAGTSARPNRYGIQVTSINAVIGGSAAGARNVISGNQSAGIVLEEGGDGADILGNYIGTTADGNGALGNSIGVFVDGGQFTEIGATSAGSGNRIFYNTSVGVWVSAGVSNRIVSNELFGNGTGGNGLAIDLGQSLGVTSNDDSERDTDSGPNRLQNFPKLVSAGVGSGGATIIGSLISTPSRRFRVELFTNLSCDPSGFGEGQSYLGSVDVDTDATGTSPAFILTYQLPVDRFITATATDLSTADTSEFSRCIRTVPHAIIPTATSLTTTETNDGGAADAGFTVGLSSLPLAQVTVPVSVSDPTEGTIVSTTPLTFPTSSGGLEQTVLLRGVDDGIDDGNVQYTVVLGQASSADPNYNGMNPADIAVTNVDDDDRALQCSPRPKVSVSVVKIGGGRLRATVSVSAYPGTQNELQSIAWTRFDTATVVVDGVGPVQVGQVTSFGTPLTQSASFVITRTPGASSGTVRLTVADGCGDWPTFIGGGPNGW